MARERWRRITDGQGNARFVKEKISPTLNVEALLKQNAQLRNDAASNAVSLTKRGGSGSYNMRHVARVDEVQNAIWVTQWRKLGGWKTGMSSKDYCLLQASLPENSKYVVTPSGKTGFERWARKKSYKT